MLRRKKKNTGKKLKREIEKSMKKAQLSHLDINDPDDINKIKEFMRLTANVCMQYNKVQRFARHNNLPCTYCPFWVLMEDDELFGCSLKLAFARAQERCMNYVLGMLQVDDL